MHHLFVSSVTPSFRFIMAVYLLKVFSANATIANPWPGQRKTQSYTLEGFLTYATIRV